jgi:hypothetical protein
MPVRLSGERVVPCSDGSPSVASRRGSGICAGSDGLCRADPRTATVGWSTPRRARAVAGESALCLFVGVDSGRERARLLDAGCGDALPASVELPELARRARRVAERGDSLPRRRESGR